MSVDYNFTLTTPSYGGYSNMTDFGMEMGPGKDLMDLKSMKQLLMAKKFKEQRAYLGPIAVKYHLILGSLILLANGFLIGFYIKYPKIRKYISVTMLAVFVVSFLQGLSETIFRPIFFSTFYDSKLISLSKEGAIKMCLTSNILHEFTVYLVALLLPLLSVERFFRVKFPHQKEMVTRNIFACTIGLIVAIALTIAFLPMTNAYTAEPVWAECDGHFVKNNYTPFALGTVAFISVIVPLIMYIQMVIIGKRTLGRGSLSERRAKIIRKASITAGVITVVYILSSVPYVVVFSIVLGCRTKAFDLSFCTVVTKRLILLYLLGVQKIGYAVAPVFFTFLHPKLRQRMVQCWTECPTDSQWSSSGTFSTTKQSKQKNINKQAVDSGLASSSSGYNSQNFVENNEPSKIEIDAEPAERLEGATSIRNEMLKGDNSVINPKVKIDSVQLSVISSEKPETKEIAVQTTPTLQKAAPCLPNFNELASRTNSQIAGQTNNRSDLRNCDSTSIECTEVWDGTKNVWHSL